MFTDKNEGFTLVEVIVVLVILAILAAVSIPALTGFIEQSQSGEAVSDARLLYVTGEVGLKDWYGGIFDKSSIVSDKRAIEARIMPLQQPDLEMTSSGNAQGWSGSNRFEVGGGALKETGAYSWTNFKNNAGSNRGIVYIPGGDFTEKGTVVERV